MLWINPDNRRYYQADLVKDLLGDWTMVKVWGGLNSHRGNMKVCLVADREDGSNKIQQLKKERKQRGYQKMPTTRSR